MFVARPLCTRPGNTGRDWRHGDGGIEASKAGEGSEEMGAAFTISFNSRVPHKQEFFFLAVFGICPKTHIFCALIHSRTGLAIRQSWGKKGKIGQLCLVLTIFVASISYKSQILVSAEVTGMQFPYLLVISVWSPSPPFCLFFAHTTHKSNFFQRPFRLPYSLTAVS